MAVLTMKYCDNCRTGIQPGTTHRAAVDYAGGGICDVVSKPRLRLHYGHAGHWYVKGPKGCGWVWPTPGHAIMDYVAFVGL